MRRALIAVALLLVSCVSALADSKSELVAWGMRMRAVIIQNACYRRGRRRAGWCGCYSAWVATGASSLPRFWSRPDLAY